MLSVVEAAFQDAETHCHGKRCSAIAGGRGGSGAAVVDRALAEPAGGSARRAKMIQRMNSGETVSAVVRRYRYSRSTVTFWRTRSRGRSSAGLHDHLKPGWPRNLKDELIAALGNTALQKRPNDQTPWSSCSLTGETGVSEGTGHRYRSPFGPQLHCTRTFKLSTDPYFVERVRDGAGMHLDSHERALVPWVDEKTQFQEPERAQHVLPMEVGHVEGIAQD